MSKWDKLLAKICALSKELRFDELRKVIESYGYQMYAPRSGSSHYIFRKTGCITCGETIEKAVGNGKEAKRLWLEAAMEEGISIPEPDNLEKYSGQFKLRIPRSLHRSLAEHSKKEGISMNQYCLYLLTKNDRI